MTWASRILRSWPAGSDDPSASCFPVRVRYMPVMMHASQSMYPLSEHVSADMYPDTCQSEHVSAAEREGNTVKGCEDFYLKMAQAKAIIWS